MTREERINSALLPILEKMREHGATDEMCKMYGNGFHVGAMWADSTMLDKVCEWLSEQMNEGNLSVDKIPLLDLIDNFIQAMEGD